MKCCINLQSKYYNYKAAANLQTLGRRVVYEKPPDKADDEDKVVPKDLYMGTVVKSGYSSKIGKTSPPPFSAAEKRSNCNNLRTKAYRVGPKNSLYDIQLSKQQQTCSLIGFPIVIFTFNHHVLKKSHRMVSMLQGGNRIRILQVGVFIRRGRRFSGRQENITGQS
ncbi:hypothetical protein AVEN_71407-1 [Araneus ventricosus]|uniref:Uncharacterized protein n=1 Tax=Araneus ventricosus TaxID=182803 RepID=A0A4Y2BHP1_ARAVE|nr:hypothetical protein AVEN_71407-1 [Araneus ventricosus]